MSSVYQLAAEIRAILRSGRSRQHTEESRRFFDEPEDEGGEALNQIRRGISRATGRRGFGSHYDTNEWQYLKNGLRLVASSNVYGYAYDAIDSRKGIVYVQYLDWTPKSLGGSGRKGGPGPVYAYSHVPYSKFQEFENMARVSAGSAIWDYFRVRGSAYAHQHPCQLIQTAGDYVPRKATRWGLRGAEPENKRGRLNASIGIGPRNEKAQRARVQLPSRKRMERLALAPRNRPNRGEPDRGEPNRGRPRREF